MKKLVTYSTLIILSFLMVACENYFDEHIPKDQIDESKVFEDDKMAQSAMAYVYTLLRNEGFFSGSRNGGGFLLACYTDELEVTDTDAAAYSNFFKGTVTSSNAMITGLWNSSYKQIYAVNNIIEGVTENEHLSIELSNRLRGEALAIRGIIHFYLANTFGQVPFITTTNYTINSKIGKNTVNQVNDFAIADLLQAEELLTTSYPSLEKVMLNKTVVQAFLARIYLYNQDYDKAQYYADTVINSGLYELEPLDKVFIKESKSAIWQFKPSGNGQNAVEGVSYTFVSLPPPNTKLSSNLLNSFENNDQRKQLWTKVVMNSQENAHAYKYKQNRPTASSLEYSVVMRLAEMYLIVAEAAAYKNDWDVYNLHINKVRNKSGLSSVNITNIESALNTIIHERRLEFFCEFGHRFYDLKRTNKLQILREVKPSWNQNFQLLPLPENELILNPNLLPQNPGY